MTFNQRVDTALSCTVLKEKLDGNILYISFALFRILSRGRARGPGRGSGPNPRTNQFEVEFEL